MKELRNMLIASIGKRLSKFDFEPCPRDQSFYRQSDSVLQVLHLSFIKHKSDFDVTADVAICFEDLERLLKSFTNAPSRDKKARIFSLGAELGNIKERRQMRWTISKEADIPSVADAILKAYVEIGQPYLAGFSSKELALRMLSRDDREAWLHSPMHDMRAMEAVGLAYLIKGPASARQLATAKEDFLRKCDDCGLNVFLEFTSKLFSIENKTS